MRRVTKKVNSLDSIGKRISCERTSLGISQKELAEKLFIKREKVTYIENDSRLPSIDELIRIANILNVSTDYLLCRANSKNTQNSEISIELGISDKFIDSLKYINKFSNIQALNEFINFFDLNRFNYSLIDYLNINFYYNKVFSPALDIIESLFLTEDNTTEEELNKKCELLDEQIKYILSEVEKIKISNQYNDLMNVNIKKETLLSIGSEIRNSKKFSHLYLVIFRDLNEKILLLLDILKLKVSSNFTSALENMNMFLDTYIDIYIHKEGKKI